VSLFSKGNGWDFCWCMHFQRPRTFVPCGSPKLDRSDHIDFSTAWKEQSGNMLAILLGLFQLICLFGRGHHAVALENLAFANNWSFTSARKSVRG
jgi:hypothetical protein